ncbi:MAG: nucleoside-triphosphatase, partial [Candidatus Villigracilaceae bacterium]
MSALYLLTAPFGAGKTTFCADLAEQARAAGWDVAGILSPPVFENGVKTGILARNLRSGETRPLATLHPSPFG